jgi:hypothetical protein
MKNLKCTVLALAMGANVFIGGKAFAQVPSYVPTNGLVGWWPFNGNTNDESGNGNNLINNSCLFNIDRFGISNHAVDLVGPNRYLGATSESIQPAISNGLNSSVSLWIKIINNSFGEIYHEGGSGNPRGFGMYIQDGSGSTGSGTKLYVLDNGFNGNVTNILNGGYDLGINVWHNLILVKNSNMLSLYIDGQIHSQGSLGFNQLIGGWLNFGISDIGNLSFESFIDDIGIWNRALTQSEITNLFLSCSNNLTLSPNNNIQNTGGNTSFTATTSDLNPTFTWQSNPSNFGWQNIPVNSTYSGINTNTLVVNNIQLANHNQPFRVIASNGNCIDTSNIATIQIADTCITNVTVYDTLLTTVTDTLIINTTLSLPAPNNENTILIYPNPASDHITIDNGNFAAMAGYSIKIENNAGQQVFQSAINQAQFYVDLSTWTGNGLYFVHLIDPQNNTVTVRKIVLQ